MSGILNGAGCGRSPFERYFAWVGALASVLVSVGFFAHTTTARAAPPYGATQCAASRIGSNLGCTANDVSINTITVAGSFLPSCVGGQTLPLDLDVTVQFQSPTRYNVGVFVSSDGKSPQLLPAGGGAAACSVATLPTSSPFLSLDGGSCGDGNGAINGGTGAGTFRMSGANVYCITDGSGNAALNIPYLVSWDQNSNTNACFNNTYPAPGTTSKCNTGTVAFPAGTSIVVLPKLTITDGLTTVSPGQSVTYTIVLENTTGSPLTNVGFRDPLPANFSFTGVTCAPAGNCPSIDTGTLASGVTVGSMPVGSKLTFSVTGIVGDVTCGTLSNTAYVTVNGRVHSATDSDVIGTACPPSVSKSFTPATIAPGDTTTLQLTLTNPTSSALTNVSFTDTFPAGLQNANTPVVTNTCGGTATAASNGNSLSLNGGTVPANSTCVVTSIVTAATSGIYVNSSGDISTTSGSIAAVSGTLTVGGVDHVRISHDGTGGVCNGDTVTLFACADPACSTLYTGGGTSVSLNPAGTWTANPVTIDSSGSATVNYQTDQKGTVRYAISSHSFDCDNTSNGTGANSTTECDAVFGDYEFVISSTDPFGNVVIAGRPHQLKVEAYRKDGGHCGVANNYKNSKTLRAWYSDAVIPSLTPAPLPTLSTSPLCSAGTPFPASGLPGAEPGSNNATLDFVDGVAAPIYLCTGDVGKFSLELKDISPTIVTGATAVLTVRPFALDVSVAGNTGATAATGAIAGVAGSNLATTVRGVLWQSADDANNDGLPDSGANLSDNATTPGYDWATSLSAATPITPVGGILGILSGTTSIAAGQFAAGAKTVDVAYSEVGSFTLNAAAADFLGASGVAVGGTSVVGRLTPHHLTTALTNTCGPFTYSGQPFLVTVEAHRNGGGVTRNYSTSGFAKEVNIGSDGAAACDPTLGGFSNTVLAATAFADFNGFADTPAIGTAVAPLPISYTQSLAAPATIAICAKDADGVNSHGQTQGSLLIRNGRLKLSNAFGSEKSDLSMPIQAQYWSGNSWLLANDDSCTGALLAAATPAVALSGYVGSLDAGNMGPSHATAISAAGPGKWNLILGKPSPAATGSVNLALNLGGGSADQSCLFKAPATPPVTSGANLPWFRGQYGSAYPDGSACPATGRDPAARGTFGVYAPETKKSIHVRELY